MRSEIIDLIDAIEDPVRAEEAWVDIMLLFDVSNAIPPDCGDSARECLPDHLQQFILTAEERSTLTSMALHASRSPLIPPAATVSVLEKSFDQRTVPRISELLRLACEREDLEPLANAAFRALVVLVGEVQKDQRTSAAVNHVLDKGVADIRETVRHWFDIHGAASSAPPNE